MPLSRRSFLARSAAAGLGLTVAFPREGTAAARRPDPAPRPVCVFSKHLQWQDYEALADTVAEAGFDGIDLTVRPGGHVLPERVEEDLPRAVEAARRAGLAVPLMVTAITGADDPHAERVLRTAAALGVSHYRMGYLRYPEGAHPGAALEAHRERLRELAALNEACGIHGAYQNHSGTNVGGPVWDLWTLLRGLDPRWIGVQYDVRHAVVEGGTAWPLGLRLLAPSIRTTAVKDFRWEKRGERWRILNVPLGEGMVDLPAYLRLAHELEVGGPVSLHFEYAPLEGPNELPDTARRRQAVELMGRDLRLLRERMRAAES